MSQTHGQKSETERIRGSESDEGVRLDAYGSQNVERIGEGIRNQCISPDREGGEEGTGASDALGGILDQLIDDAQKQLVKSLECIVWYQSEARECEQKLNNLVKLKELQARQKEEQQQLEPINHQEESSPE
ncbi:MULTISPECIES: hypothetical protein [unclassified Microcoleus]|uniref:hypothetical protein n=1 Tax=unclassified Microcoleus TaxID=2642155 RepID=UPI001DE2EA64|nr:MULTISPECIES: hypothetical protein [unclassified Microcoleus]MCC3469904.1 hypothetical protein [Microcoleus sp. PH2017_06_SFM_O_A]TAE44177.1 MAG: hypothetical protein EAZ90_07210 [Oscillatoriales cyanobacterium]MCC3411072.1 hypothetical protein [Microcoleus sp. PH2017_02_FOX_O_A]MCC3490376.1 hypothetical protein [Microcoleus sp. PH2017_16_JOR_D_A]MCC3514999.1 hypothetical protein [Microcoleus sp. PH2017_18_LLB_O_A]